VLEVIQIVPAIPVEDIRHHRRAQQVAHLGARHADLQLVDGLAFQVIALLDVEAIDATAECAREHHCRERDEE
jgi:hypothetical protein